MKAFSILNLILTLIATGFFALFSDSAIASTHSWRQEDSRPGYAETLDPEQENTGEILYAVENPYRNELKMSERIFDTKLKKDITQRYQEKFGRTEAEIIHTRTPYLNSNFSEGASITFNEEQYQKQQKSFGNYIAKRVVEYHFENEAKDNPQLRGAYDAKQVLENASASVGEFKIRARYRIASNSIMTSLKNPYVNLEARNELSGNKETVYSASKELGKRYSIITDYYKTESRWDWILRKSLTNFLGLSFTYSVMKDVYVTENFQSQIVDQKSYIAGLSYIF